MVQDRLNSIYQRRYLFEGTPPQPQASRVTRVGARDGRTGLWEVIHPDGSVTLNGIANFSRGIAPGTVVSGIPTGDGFIVLNAENLLPTVEELLQPGLQQVLFFSVANGAFTEPPETATFDINPVIDSVSFYVKVGLNPPLLIAELDVPRMATLFGIFLPNSKLIQSLVDADGGQEPTLSVAMQVCTALSPTLFLINATIVRQNLEGTRSEQCCYTAIASTSGIIAEQLSPCAAPDSGRPFFPGDPLGDVAWLGALLPYADLLPTRESDRPGIGGFIRAAAYEEVGPRGRYNRTNIDGDGRVTIIDQDFEIVNWGSTGIIPTFLPIGYFVGQTQLPVTRDGQAIATPLTLSLPFSTWAGLGVVGQQVWGLRNETPPPAIIPAGVSTPLTEIYSNPDEFLNFRTGDDQLIPPREDSGDVGTLALVFSPNAFTGGETGLYNWTTSPYQIVSMPEVKAIGG